MGARDHDEPFAGTNDLQGSELSLISAASSFMTVHKVIIDGGRRRGNLPRAVG